MSFEPDFGNYKIWTRPESNDTLYRTSLESAQHIGNLDAREFDIAEAYDKRIAEIETATGQKLDNPMKLAPTWYGGMAQSQPTFTHYMLNASNPLTAIGAAADIYRRKQSEPERRALFQAQLRELAAKHPEHAGVIRPDELPDELVKRRAAEIEQAAADAAESRGLVEGRNIPGLGWAPIAREVAAFGYNATTNLSATWSQFRGGFEGTIPSWERPDRLPDFLLNFVGFGRTSSVKSLAKNALINAIDSAAAEAAVQPFRQMQRRDLGLDYGWSQALSAIEGAAGAGAALDLGARGLGRGALKIMGRDVAPDQVFSRHGRGGILRDAPEPAREPVTRETIAKAREGDVGAMEAVAKAAGVEHDPEVRGAINYEAIGAKADADLLAKIKAAGFDIGEGTEMLSHALRGGYYRIVDQLPPAKQAFDHEALARLGQTHLDALDPILAEARKSVGTLADRLSAIGHPAVTRALTTAAETLSGAEKNLSGAGEAAGRAERAVAGTPLAEAAKQVADAVAGLESDLGREKLSDLIQMHDVAAGPLKVAEALRRSPELADDSLPMRSPVMRTARALAALDGAGWEAVQAGRVTPEQGALIANRVPPGRHLDAVEMLKGSADLDEAAARIDAMPLGRSVLPDGGVMDPNSGDGKRAAEATEKSMAGKVAKATEATRRREEAEKAFEQAKGALAKLKQAEDDPGYKHPETGLPMSEREVRSYVEMWAEVKAYDGKPPKTLSEFVSDRGGKFMREGGVERFQRTPEVDVGLLADEAWRAGYLPGKRASVETLFAALEREAGGDPVVRKRDEAALNAHGEMIAKREELRALGLLDKTSPAKVWKAFGGPVPEDAIPAPKPAKPEKPEAPSYRHPITEAPITEAEVNDFANMWREVKAYKGRKPRSLNEYIRDGGGALDPNGDLAAMGLQHLIKQKTGLHLDHIGERAYEQGYFPRRPSVDELLEAIGEDAGGTPVLRQGDLDAAVKHDEIVEMRDHLAQAGVLKAKNLAELWKKFEAPPPKQPKPEPIKAPDAQPTEADKRRAKIAEQQAEVSKLERAFEAAKKAEADTLKSEDGLTRDLGIANRLGQLGDLIAACRA